MIPNPLIGDIDGDGDLDSRWGMVTQQNYVYINVGYFFHLSFWTSPTNYDAKSIELADIDDDGDLDMIVGSGIVPMGCILIQEVVVLVCFTLEKHRPTFHKVNIQLILIMMET